MIYIEHGDKRPIYEQIADRFRFLILHGVLKEKEQLPSVRSLALELSINPNTIQRAFSLLEQEGLIFAVKGKGNFVKKVENLAKLQHDRLLELFEEQACACLKQGVKKEELLERLEKLPGRGIYD